MPATTRLNLSKITCLLADRDNFTRGLIAQMLRGFGLAAIRTASTGAEAKEIIAAEKPDICFIEAALPDMTAAELLGWVRRQPPPLRFVPIVVMSGYTQLRLISTARDGGAHIVIRKPVSPQVLFDRIAWVAGFTRPFIETGKYVGPDRRFHAIAPPDGAMKREDDEQAAPP